MASMSSMASQTSSAVAAATTAAMAMSMGGGMDTCKISMLWNWYTVGACFISSTWQIKSNAMFVGSCIGVALLTMSLELLRRLSREYDTFLQRRFQRSLETHTTTYQDANDASLALNGNSRVISRVTPLQQLTRAIIHAATFGVAYMIMLLAMYYNGYIIISIIIGAGLGKFVCDWMVLLVTTNGVVGSSKNDGTCEDPTVCCG